MVIEFINWASIVVIYSFGKCFRLAIHNVAIQTMIMTVTDFIHIEGITRYIQIFTDIQAIYSKSVSKATILEEIVNYFVRREQY